MDVLLIRPPATFVAGSLADRVEMPLGLLYVAAACERAGHRVTVYDAAIDYDLDAMNRSGSGRVHVGGTWEAIARRVAERRYDVIGVSNPFYTQFPNAVKAVEIVRDLHPRARVLMGGPHPTAEPVAVLGDAPAVDFVVRGEGEETTVELLRAIETGADAGEVAGIAFRRDSRAVLTRPRDFIRDLDSVGLPAYPLIDPGRYLRQPRFRKDGRWDLVEHRVVPLLTSRGCPFDCCFCCVHVHMGRPFRAHSPEFVINHVRHIVRKLGVRELHFVDDNLAQSRERLEAILDGLIALGAEGEAVTWETPNGVRTDRLTPDLLRKAKRAGCRSILLTVESGSQRVLDEVIRKRLDLRQVVEVARGCRKIGLKTRAGFIMGLPGETLDDMRRTVEFAHMLRRDFGVKGHASTATPYFGTELYRQCVAGGYLVAPMTPERLSTAVQGDGMIATPEFSAEDVKEMRRLFRRRDSLTAEIAAAVRRPVKRCLDALRDRRPRGRDTV